MKQWYLLVILLIVRSVDQKEYIRWLLLRSSELNECSILTRRFLQDFVEALSGVVTVNIYSNTSTICPVRMFFKI